MNTFGRYFRISLFGESHGPAVGVLLDGVLPGISLEASDFTVDLDRRKAGAKGTTPRQEEDSPSIISGVFEGKTTGAPLTILFNNNHTRSEDYDAFRAVPRPGHADFVAEIKYGGYQDYRGGGHFSGRLTLALVAAGVVAKKILLKKLPNLQINAALTMAGGIEDIDLAIEKAIEDNDSIGGIISCTVKGLPVGLGEPFFDTLESLISHLVFAIPAVKGIEFGAGFSAASMKGSTHNDAIIDAQGRSRTNYAGGISGGISNGNDLFFRVAVKPTSSTPKEQITYNKETQQEEPFKVTGRHDLCIALRVPVVVEAVTAVVLTDLLLLEQIAATQVK